MSENVNSSLGTPPAEAAIVTPTSSAATNPTLLGNPPVSPIVAKAGQYYRNTRYIMTAVTIIMGFWFLYDGFVRYPAENKKVEDLRSEQTSAIARHDDAAIARISTDLKSHVYHSHTDLVIQRGLAFVLPPAGLLLLLWALYNSRGRYQLSDDVLQVPGHPPIPLAAIQELDETQWDRKGIAFIRYVMEGHPPGKFRLDDFVYDRIPTDKIVDRIKKSLQADIEQPPEPNAV